MRQFVRMGVLALSAAVAFGDVVELKDDASIKGRIIAEKAEHVAVDVGYTILMVPRTAIAKIVTPKDEEATEEKKGENTTAPASAAGVRRVREALGGWMTWRGRPRSLHTATR